MTDLRKAIEDAKADQASDLIAALLVAQLRNTTPPTSAPACHCQHTPVSAVREARGLTNSLGGVAGVLVVGVVLVALLATVALVAVAVGLSAVVMAVAVRSLRK